MSSGPGTRASSARRPARNPGCQSRSRSASTSWTRRPSAYSATRGSTRCRAQPVHRQDGRGGLGRLPVRASDGGVLGTLCVADTRARQWTGRDRTTLEILVGTASTEVALRTALDEEQTQRARAEAVAEELQQTNAELAKTATRAEKLATTLPCPTSWYRPLPRSPAWARDRHWLSIGDTDGDRLRACSIHTADADQRGHEGRPGEGAAAGASSPSSAPPKKPTS